MDVLTALNHSIYNIFLENGVDQNKISQVFSAYPTKGEIHHETKKKCILGYLKIYQIQIQSSNI